MENKQTAVEWLEEQFIWMIEEGVDWFDAFHSVMSKLEEAKQMEKEQMLGFYTSQIFFDDSLPSRFEQYYNETYGK